MSIASKIQSIEEHLTADWKSIGNLGLDTSIDNNIENIANVLNDLYDKLPKVTGSGTNVTINNTSKGKMILNLGSNELTQGSTTGKNLAKIESSYLTESSGITPTYNATTGAITLTGTKSGINLVEFTSQIPISLEANKTYTLSIKNAISYNLNLSLSNGAGAIINAGFTSISVTPSVAITNYKLYLSSVPDGTSVNETLYVQIEEGSTASNFEPYYGTSPNPIHAEPIHTISGSNTIKVEGSNLLNRTTCVENKALVWSDGTTYNQTNSLSSDYIKINVNDKVSMNYNSQIMFYDISKNYLGNLNPEGTALTKYTGIETNSFTVPSGYNIAYMRLGFRTGANNNENMTAVNIMVNLGDTLLPYTPYTLQQADINLGNIEYCKIGNYEDKFIRNSGKNLFDINTLDGSANMTISNDKLILAGSTAYHVTNVGVNLKDIANLKVGETYYLNYKTTYTGSDYDKIYLRGTTSYWVNGTSHTITQAELDDRIAFYGTNNSEISELIISKENIDYEPYGSNEWYIKKNIGKTIITNDNVNSIITNYNGTSFAVPFVYTKKAILGWQNVYQPTGICLMNKYKEITAVSSISNGTFASNFSEADIYIFNNNFTDLATARTELIGTEIYIAQATPTYTPITGTLANQLENVYQKLLSYDGQTNISQVNDDLSFVISASALQDLSTL